jgi:protein-S-isoprenylcysteine O-methyltransferase Ste14
LITLPPLVGLGAVLFRFHAWILGADLGTSLILISIAIILDAVMGWLEIKTWRQLSIRIAVGLPELSRTAQGKGKLLKDGAYRLVRHPRYLSAGIGVIGNALIINHVGMYVMILLVYPAGFVMLMFEERDLVDRFGEEYLQYQREVPKIIPRFGRAK